MRLTRTSSNRKYFGDLFRTKNSLIQLNTQNGISRKRWFLRPFMFRRNLLKEKLLTQSSQKSTKLKRAIIVRVMMNKIMILMNILMKSGYLNKTRSRLRMNQNIHRKKKWTFNLKIMKKRTRLYPEGENIGDSSKKMISFAVNLKYFSRHKQKDL